MSGPGLWLALGAAVASGYLAALQRALLQYSPSRLEELLARRGRLSRLGWLEQVDRWVLMVAVCRAMLQMGLVGAMLWSVWPAGSVPGVGRVAGALAGAWGLLVVLDVAVAMSWGRHAAESLVAGSLVVLKGLAVAAGPLMWLLGPVDPLMRRLLGVQRGGNGEGDLETQILDAVSEVEKTGRPVDARQKEMIEAIVDFADTTVDQIMTPRTDVVGLEADWTIQQVTAAIAEHGHSRYPVYEGDLDHIVGMLYAKDLLRYVGAGRQEEFHLRQVVRQALFIPETKALPELLKEMQTRKVHIALVLDEYGGTAGLVTIEDIVEEIVGEIRDEYEPDDKSQPVIEPLDERTAMVEGRVYIDDVNDQLGLSLPEDEDYDTVGGFVFSTLGHIPEVGESFEYDGIRVTVVEAEKTRVNRVKIEKLAGPSTTVESAGG